MTSIGCGLISMPHCLYAASPSLMRLVPSAISLRRTSGLTVVRRTARAACLRELSFLQHFWPAGAQAGALVSVEEGVKERRDVPASVSMSSIGQLAVLVSSLPCNHREVAAHAPSLRCKVYCAQHCCR